MTPPAPTRNRWSWRSLHRPRVILALVLPLRIAAVVGLTAMVALIVRERGDVNGLVWLRSGVLAILAWTVTTQLRSLARSHRSRRWGSAAAESTPRPLLATVSPQRLVAARTGQPIGGGGVRRQRLRGATAAASWWMLIVAVVGICVVAVVLVVAWMVDDLTTSGAGPWLVGQVLLLAGATFAIGWTVWMAVRSAADLRSRRRRPLVQRFLNWLVRLLSLNRSSALTATAPSPGATVTATGGAGASSTGLAAVREAATAGPLFAHRVVATALVATASMVTGAAALADSSDAGHQPETVVAGAVAEPGGAGPVPIPPAAGSAPDDSGTPVAPAPTTSTTPVVPPASTTSTTSPPTPTTSLPLVPPTPSSTVPTTTSLPLVPPTPSSTVPTTTTLPRSSTTTTTTAAPTTTSTTAPPTTTSVPASCGPRGNPDTDCDGISDAQEITYGSDPDNRASRPEGRDWDTLVDGRTCADRLDNDADGRTDDADPGCSG